MFNIFWFCDTLLTLFMNADKGYDGIWFFEFFSDVGNIFVFQAYGEV